MKKLLLASLTLGLMTFGALAHADEAPAAPTGSAATPAPSGAKAARKAEHEKMKAENAEMADKVKAACAADISTTGCSQEMGKGLMKCIHGYKQAHKDFKLSDSCKAAVEEGHEMHKEHKAERAQMKGAAPAAAPAPAGTH